MPQIIDVPGMGQVSFPDGMTDAEISTAIQRNMGASPNLAELHKALLNAQAAGDTRAVTILADAIHASSPNYTGLDYSDPLSAASLASAESIREARGRATYEVTHADGRTLELTGEGPPTKDQLDRIFAQASPAPSIWELAARKTPEPPSMAPYWIAGGVVLFVVVFILLRKWLKSRPWQVIPHAVRSAAKMKDKMMFDLSDQDAEWFTAAEEELVSGNIDKATWARALVKARGNEEKRKVDYILLRVKKMRLGES